METNIKHDKKTLQKILEAIPVNYYQKGVKCNLLQNFWHTHKLSTVLSQISHSPKKILDVGCASGWFLSQLSNNFPDSVCFGIDSYKKAILYGENLYPYLKLITADVHNLPYPDKKFDLVVCTEVLEHVTNPLQVIKEILRVTKKNGQVIIEMDSGNWLFNLVWSYWIKLNGKVWHNAHLQIFNAQKLKNYIESTGFKIIGTKYFNFGMAVSYLCTPLPPHPHTL